MQKHIFSMRKHKLTFSPVPASSMQKARICPIESVFGRLRRPGGPVFTGENKRGRDTKVSLPLLTPQPFLCADTSEMCSETGVTGARFRASGSLWDAVMP